MRHGSRIFSELVCSQKRDILNSLHASGIHIRRELGVTIHGKALFQAELEPVPAGDSIARVIVKILMRHDGFDTLIAQVSRNIWMSQNARCIKNV